MDDDNSAKRRKENDEEVDGSEEERKQQQKRSENGDEHNNVGTNDDSDDSRRRRRKKRSRRKHHKKKKTRSEKRDSSSRKRKRKHRDDDDDDDSFSQSSTSGDDDSLSDNSSSSDSEYRRRRRRRRKHKHRKRDRKQKKKRKKAKNKDGSSDEDNDSGPPAFGKYGIIKQADYTRMQRSFQMWMAEVKGISNFNGPKWEQQKYFSDFCEDYNTATLPHRKYYDYDQWEAAEYAKKKKEASAAADTNALWADEQAHAAKQHQQARAQQAKERMAVLASMDRDKVQDMKQQAALQSQLQMAFRTGDQQAVNRLKERLKEEPT